MTLPTIGKILQFAVGLASTAMVVVGLTLSSGDNAEGIVLDRPGSPARLIGEYASATAFFEIDGDALELTMLFSEPDDPDSVFRTSVRLTEGQSHTIVIGEADEEDVPQRFTFRRNGYTVEMQRAPVTALNASFVISN